MDKQFETKLRKIFSVQDGEEKIRYTSSVAMDKFWQMSLDNTEDAKEFAQKYGFVPVIINEAISEVERGNFFNNGIVSSDLRELKGCQENLTRLRTLGVDFINSCDIEGHTASWLLTHALQHISSRNRDVWRKLQINKDERGLYYPLADIHAYIIEQLEQVEQQKKAEKERAKEIMRRDRQKRRFNKIKHHFVQVKDKFSKIFFGRDI